MGSVSHVYEMTAFSNTCHYSHRSHLAHQGHIPGGNYVRRVSDRVSEFGSENVGCSLFFRQWPYVWLQSRTCKGTFVEIILQVCFKSYFVLLGSQPRYRRLHEPRPYVWPWLGEHFSKSYFKLYFMLSGSRLGSQPRYRRLCPKPRPP